MQFDPLGAAGPGVHELVVDLGLAGEDGELCDGAGLLEVDAVLDGDAGLELGELDEGVARFPAETLEFGAGALSVAEGPGFEAPEDEEGDEGGDEKDEEEGERPGDLSFAVDVGHERRTSNVERRTSNEERAALRRKCMRSMFSVQRFPFRVQKSTAPRARRHEGRLFPPEQLFTSCSSRFGLPQSEKFS